MTFDIDVLGFVKKADLPLGDARLLTVVLAAAPNCTELLLETTGHPAVGPFNQALMQSGIPYTSFAVDDTCGNLIQFTGERMSHQ